MKKLSHKDLIIALGILVAALVVITSIYFKDAGAERNSMKIQDKKIKPAAIIESVVHKFYSRTLL